MNASTGPGSPEAEGSPGGDSPQSRTTFDRDVATTLGSRVAILIVGILQSVVVARYLLPAGRGQYATVMLIPQLMVTMIPLGVQWSLPYYLRQKKHSREDLLQTGTSLALLLGLIGLVATWIVSLRLHDSFLAGLTVLAIAGATLTVPVRVLQALWQGAFRGTSRILHANLVNAARPTLLLLGAIVTLTWLGLGVQELVFALLIAESIVAVAGGYLVFRGFAMRFHLDPKIVADLLSYGMRIYFFSVLLFINYRLGLAIIRYLVGYEEVGYYVTAIGVAEILWMVPTSLSFVLFPSVVDATHERRNRVTSMVCRVTSGIMFGVCLMMAAVAYPAVWVLYGQAYLPAVLPLVALLPGILAMSLQQVLGTDLAARGRPGFVTLAAAVGIPVNAALNLWWIPGYGAVGAALASSVSYSIVTLIVLALFRRVSGIGLFRTLVPTSADFRDILGRVRRLVGRR